MNDMKVWLAKQDAKSVRSSRGKEREAKASSVPVIAEDVETSEHGVAEIKPVAVSTARKSSLYVEFPILQRGRLEQKSTERHCPGVKY